MRARWGPCGERDRSSVRRSGSVHQRYEAKGSATSARSEALCELHELQRYRAELIPEVGPSGVKRALSSRHIPRHRSCRVHGRTSQSPSGWPSEKQPGGVPVSCEHVRRGVSADNPYETVDMASVLLGSRAATQHPGRQPRLPEGSHAQEIDLVIQV